MIKILPYEHMQLDESCDFNDFKSDDIELDDLLGSNYIFTNLGREAINLIMKLENLKREDEVFITTTTDSSFVSTCVSGTIFNYSKISRVLTDKTKMIFVIHNFGFPHPDLLKLRELADERGIVLVEDCAFALDSYNSEGILLGSIGDYTIYSLSKTLPLPKGGILKSKKRLNLNSNREIEKLAKRYIPYLREFKRRRQSNYKFLEEHLDVTPIYSYNDSVNPFMFGFYHPNASLFYEKYEDIYQFSRTHVENEVHIPVNPFICKESYIEMIEDLKEIL